MSDIINIAIDGPAGAGKSTIAKKLAAKTGFIYVDTGAMYRALTLYLMRKNIRPDDVAAIEQVLDDIDITLEYEDGMQIVKLNGENVNDKIRTQEIGINTSTASKNKCVRTKLLSLQRNIAATNNVIMDGRDIGSFVLPDAKVKIYLTASASKRAYRRWLELKEKGECGDVKQIEKEIIERDEQDMSRENSPLVQAPDAVLVDTSDMNIEQVVDTLYEIYRRAANE